MKSEVVGQVKQLQERVNVCNLRGLKTPRSIADKFSALGYLVDMPENEFTLAQIKKNFETLQTLVQAFESKESKSDVSFVQGERILSAEALTKRAYSVIMKIHAIAQIKQESARRIAELEQKMANQISKIPLAQKSEADKLINALGMNFTSSDIVESELDSDD